MGWATAEAALQQSPPAVRMAILALSGALAAARQESLEDLKTRYRLAQVYAAYTTDLGSAARHLQQAVRMDLPGSALAASQKTKLARCRLAACPADRSVRPRR